MSAVALGPTAKMILFQIASEELIMWDESKDEGDEEGGDRPCYGR